MESESAVCAACGHLNPAENRFCGGCGVQLPLRCPSCGNAIPPGDRFCGACGTPVGSGASPMETPAAPSSQSLTVSAPVRVEAPPRAAEERRLVTALFCDLVGFTPLSESLDPEHVRDLQAEYFGRMAEQVERYGGTVEKYAGDAVLALFGAQIAHEDDAERAVLCALGMRQTIEPVAARARDAWQVDGWRPILCDRSLVSRNRTDWTRWRSRSGERFRPWCRMRNRKPKRWMFWVRCLVSHHSSHK
ncbi:MAG: double zinc ribbon domain-containing protein [Chloroflexota bacterium]